MEKRDFTDMVIFFCQKVSEMNISQKYRMELLGMITAIEMKHDELVPKWTPVTEALPEEKNMVLVTTVDDDIKTSFLTDKNYWWNIGRGKVTAWMPLPEPWRGDR